MSKLQITDLTFAYPGSFENVFENVSLTLDSDWKLGLIGRNGRGKTTLLRLLLGEYSSCLLYTSTLREKIAHYLTQRQDDQGRIRERLSREEMAAYMGAARPSLSRELGCMQEEGILRMEGRRIEILDQTALEQYL